MNRYTFSMSMMAAAVASLVFLPLQATAAEPGTVSTFDVDNEGWMRMDALNSFPMALGAVNGALRFQFNTQTVPFPEVSTIYADSSVAGSAFTGDYYMGGVTSISFRVLAEDFEPDALRLYIRNAENDNRWYVVLTGITVGDWTHYRIPLEYAAGWQLDSGGTQAQFDADIRNISWLGLRIQRNSLGGRQYYQVDDFALEGVPLFRNISGFVSYNGDLQGDIKVLASTSVTDDQTDYISTMSTVGAFSFDIPNRSNYYISAYMDVDGDGLRGDLEPSAYWVSNPAPHAGGDVAGVQLPLSDLMSPDGLPWWWLNQFFGLSPSQSQGGSGSSSYADLDSDGDGMTNYEEFRAVTDPTNPGDIFVAQIDPDVQGGAKISWKSGNNRAYTVLRSESLSAGFIEVATGVAATPPVNMFEDTTITDSGPYFYQVVVEK